MKQNIPSLFLFGLGKMKVWGLSSCEENVIKLVFFLIKPGKIKSFEYAASEARCTQMIANKFSFKAKRCFNKTIYTLQHNKISWGKARNLTASGKEVENALWHPSLSWVALEVWRTSGLTQQTWNLLDVQSLHCLWVQCWFPTASLHDPNFSCVFSIAYKMASCLRFSTRKKLLLSSSVG